MPRKPLDFEWMAKQKRLKDAAAMAEWIIDRSDFRTWPIHPLAIASEEKPLLMVCSGDYKKCFDGRLEYHRTKGRFLLFFNTKYDTGLPSGEHAPRTRFSIAHELGHFFINTHHEWLRVGGKPHPSRSEFVSDVMLEQEADAFAAHLLMPKRFFQPLVNDDELTLSHIDNLATTCKTSFVSTAIRAVRSSHFPCAVAGIRNGVVAWSFVSDSLVSAGFYPGPRHSPLASAHARRLWDEFHAGSTPRAVESGWAKHWFRVYKDSLANKPVTENYHPVQIMETLIVLLTIPEEEIFEESE